MSHKGTKWQFSTAMSNFQNVSPFGISLWIFIGKFNKNRCLKKARLSFGKSHELGDSLESILSRLIRHEEECVVAN